MDRLGDYRLLGEIARGAGGIIHRAVRADGGPTVALKVMRDEIASEHARERFRREARMAARLKHPNIIPVLDAGEADGRFFYTMPVIDGRGFGEMLAIEAVPEERIARIVAKVARAVHYAHGQGVVHRDLKPSNILVGPDDEPYVADFGVARDQHRETILTVTGELLGTPSYMAPEQVLGRANLADARTDVYALGAILYLALTRRPPFEATNFVELSAQVVQLEPLAPSTLRPGVDPALERICLQCLQKFPEDRYESALAVADALASVTRPTSPVAPVRRRRMLPIAALLGAFGIGGGCLLLRPADVPPAQDGMIAAHTAWIDRTEVTQADYARFVLDTNRRPPPGWRNGHPPKGSELRPVTNVTWDDAAAFAAWAGKRLPTVEEWRDAARGMAGLDPVDLVCAETSIDDGCIDAGSGRDVTASGAVNLGGNVAEWTATNGSVGDRFKLVCGGTWKTPARACLSLPEEEMPRETREPTIGFRCAKDRD